MADFDIYQSNLARSQLTYDGEDCRRSLYTNTKADHPADHLTGGPCRCEEGDDSGWERSGVAMTVRWPPELRRTSPELEAG
jgi:hypothetical protein